MDVPSSFIDGSIAIVGIIAVLAAAAWAVMAAGSAPAVERKTAEPALRMPLK
jgi:hypothetical protein